jgi:hypothetical protein
MRACRHRVPPHRPWRAGRRQRIAHVDGVAFLVDAGDVAHPGGDPQAPGIDGRTRLQPVADGAEQALRQLLRAVHGDLPGAVAERRVAEASEQCGLVAFDVRRPGGTGRSASLRGA